MKKCIKLNKNQEQILYQTTGVTKSENQIFPLLYHNEHGIAQMLRVELKKYETSFKLTDVHTQV